MKYHAENYNLFYKHVLSFLNLFYAYIINNNTYSNILKKQI